jgi:hypothetical protein
LWTFVLVVNEVEFIRKAIPPIFCVSVCRIAEAGFYSSTDHHIGDLSSCVSLRLIPSIEVSVCHTQIRRNSVETSSFAPLLNWSGKGR